MRISFWRRAHVFIINNDVQPAGCLLAFNRTFPAFSYPRERQRIFCVSFVLLTHLRHVSPQGGSIWLHPLCGVYKQRRSAARVSLNRIQSFSILIVLQQCPAVEKEEKVLEREELSAIVKSFVIIFKESQSLPFVVLLDVEVSNVFPDWSTKKLVEFLKCSLRTLSVTLSLTASTQRERQSPLWTSSTLWSVRAELSTDLEDKLSQN